MKKCWIVLLVMFLFTGCGAAETFETVSDDFVQSVMVQMLEIRLELPDSAAAEALSGEDGGTLYFCDDYVLTVQTMDAGDMDRTAQTLSGFSTDSLTIMETVSGGVTRRDWVWTAAGEGGDQIGRAAVLDDGTYHYCVTVMTDADIAGSLEEEWDGIFASFSIAP